MAKNKNEKRYQVQGNQKKIEMLYHKGTDTVWTNAQDWEKRFVNEGYDWGVINDSSTNLMNFMVQMGDLGYVRVPDERIPFELMTKLKEERGK